MSDFFAGVMPSLMTMLLFTPLIYGLYLSRQGKLTADKLCGLLLISGVILRLCYITYTDEFTRQHDLGSFTEENDSHAGYMLYLMENKSLPDFDPRGRWQFYHPPLSHIIGAVVLSAVKAMGRDYTTAGPQVLSVLAVLYSSAFSFFAYKTFALLGLKGRGLCAATAAAAFHPTLIILSGSLNNDMLSAMFGMSALYFTVRWSRKKSFSDILFIALSVGLGMMTKLTVGLLAPAIAAVFLTVFVKDIEHWKRLILQFVSFGIVCVPLGMFWPVRNLVKFGVPMNYVPEATGDVGQHIDLSAAKRLFDFSIYQFSSPFTQWTWDGASYNEFNPIIALLKNAMFDEETFFQNSITLQSFCTVLFFAGAAAAVISAAAIVLLWKKSEKLQFEMKLLLSVTFAVILVNYIVFCINFPYVCTENMRYCVPLIFAGAAAGGLMIDRAEVSKSKFEKTLAKGFFVSANMMSGLSMFIYCVMMFYNAV